MDTVQTILRKVLDVYQREAPKPSHLRGPLEVELSADEINELVTHKDDAGEHEGHIAVGPDGTVRAFGVVCKVAG